MTQSTNALERLINRQKPVVPSRDDVVNDIKTQDIKPSRHQDSIASNSQDIKPSRYQDSVTLNSQESSLSINPDNFETIRNTTRIESTVDQALRNFCQQNKITKETWFEAAYLYLSKQPEAMDEVKALASQRLLERKQIADHRRAVAMQKRLIQ